jgi:ion channel
MNRPARNPYREQCRIIRKHLDIHDAGLTRVFLAERAVVTVLCCLLILSPSMLVRYVSGIFGRVTRKIAVDVYVLFKTGLAVCCLYAGIWSHKWFVWLAPVMLIDLFAFICGLVLLRGFWRSPVSLNRTLILLGFNFIEYTAWFAGLYLASSGLIAGNEIVTDLTTALYFSIVTAATVGYGDILPKECGRLLAMLQIVASLCFLTAIVAYFIAGLDRRKPDAAPPDS